MKVMVTRASAAALGPVLAAGLVLGSAGGATADRRGPAPAAQSAPGAAKAAYPTGQVDSRTGLYVRSRPTVYSTAIASLRPQQRVLLNCQKRGGFVQGNPVWYRLQGAKGWVSARYVHNLQPVRAC
ncbi:SH3 domain-containing protein [Streptomyces sp. NRRL S-87]|uniref:SH3 domain-containing protein n=1 Tax=Streptomyces sp. NRRL S-87 TaxID=1463920 RepID=UPI00099C6EAF|nr:SH3 domain-containing protein [Streptomyces sp. NRRL S-87]